MNLIIKHPEEDVNGNSAENIFLAYDNSNNYLGYSYVYPSFNYEMTTTHPYNIFVDISVNNAVDDLHNIQDMLFNSVMERAHELRNMHRDINARIYAGCFPNQKDKLEFFLSKNFTHDDGTYLLEKDLTDFTPIHIVPDGIEIRENLLLSQDEKNDFITLCNQIFFQKLDMKRLEELAGNKLWTNFSVYSGCSLVGNIMVYEKDSIEPVGHVENLFILNGWKCKGLAKFLMDKAHEYFKSKGINKSQLEVWGANVNAMELYKTLGYYFVEEKEFYPGIDV